MILNIFQNGKRFITVPPKQHPELKVTIQKLKEDIHNKQGQNKKIRNSYKSKQKKRKSGQERKEIQLKKKT